MLNLSQNYCAKNILFLTLFSTKEMDEVLLLSAICKDDLNNLASISGLVTRGVCCCWGDKDDWTDCTGNAEQWYVFLRIFLFCSFFKNINETKDNLSFRCMLFLNEDYL